ncbi:MAG TPA: Rieske 2Fe-2S domain-containing protein [Beijerinckiaceae bacterium]|jgi:nitrite reductase/ring-hydroxylating ferredoxin subunit
MLRPDDNEKLTRVGPGTPGGAFLRRYWHAILLSDELPEADGAPLRVRVLGEHLLAFRDTDGVVGMIDAYCPHRRAPLFFGRNEACGLRCVYHGWKFDRRGDCVDMPSEPAGTPLQARVKIKAYPTYEKAGVIFVYMGPADAQPPPPDYEWMRAPQTHRFVSKTFESCNYLQALEGGLDTAHSSYAHNNDIANKNMPRNRDKAPRIEVELTDYGYRYVSLRRVDDANDYVRVYQYIMPTQQMRGSIVKIEGGRAEHPRFDGHIWTPIDDETCFVFNTMYSYDADAPLPPDLVAGWESRAGRGPEHHIPGTFRLIRNQSNDYLIDRQTQKTRTFTGIEGVNTQDYALQEGMGPIADRSLEHLGASDKAIVAMRRMMLRAIDAVSAGEAPPGVAPETHGRVRPHDNYVPIGADWRAALEHELAAKW